MMTDPIADMLTRIRNGIHREFKQVSVPKSSVKVGICDTLKREGYILGYEIKDDPRPQGSIVINLKYGPDNERVIQKVRRVSRPGQRIYLGYEQLPKVLGGLGITIVSTNKGIKSDRECRREKLGGEVLAEVQ